MAGIGKWLLGGLGWAVGGPIGGIIGFALGAISEEAQTKYNPAVKSSGSDFSAALIVLCAAVMKSDNKVMRSEVEYIRNFFVRNFGIAKAQESILLLREILKQEIPVHEVCTQIRDHVDLSSRFTMLHLLFGIAGADGEYGRSEVEMIRTISMHLGISDRDFISIKAMFVPDEIAAYKILEIEKNVPDEEVKKAYRKMAMKFHPDKVAHLGTEYQKDAQEKFRKINEAYEQIKKERGIN